MTSEELAKEFGMTESMADTLRKHRLRRLGQLGRMPENRTPKQMLFGELTRDLAPSMEQKSAGGIWQ